MTGDTVRITAAGVTKRFRRVVLEGVDDPTTLFDRQRPRLLGIAYGITGDHGEAEDVVQEAWIRLCRETAGIEDVTAWLVVVTSRLALDTVRSARSRRENYVGPWLPEPVVADPRDDPAERAEHTETLSMALLVVLETLSPAERTAFVLREVFGVPAAEVADAVGRSPASVRQLAKRARTRIRQRTPRFDTDPVRQREVVDAFASACDGADLDALLRLLDPEVVLRTDGGGLVRAAPQPVSGADKVARFLVGVTRKAGGRRWLPVRVNGAAGLVRLQHGHAEGVVVPIVEGGRITAVHIVRHPGKLTRTRAWIRQKGMSDAGTYDHHD